MSDLIRRRDAVLRMSDLLMVKFQQGQRLPTWNEVYQAMNDVPSVEPDHIADDSKKASYSCGHENDLISRQAAIDAIRKDMYADKDYMSAIICEGIENVLNNLPSAEPERKWISVSEALPKDMDRLLVTIVRSDGSKRVRSGDYYKGYFMLDNGDIWNETDKEVLAWMPLPEPWRGE